MMAPVSPWYIPQSFPNHPPPPGHSNPPQKRGYGTGTAWYKTGDESQLDQTCIDSAKTAINLGYHHLDGAEVYKTETELGTAIKQSGVAREKLYIVTKVLPNIADIPAALNTSLKKLGVDHVDLYVASLRCLEACLLQEASAHS
jgi:diketogulonate reductase-like aldo/keto reductase